MNLSGFYNMDCLVGMREIPDKYFDLAIVDPPYGGCGEKIARAHTKCKKKYGKAQIAWDIEPDKIYFDELFRISKEQIIWGGISLICHLRGILSYGEKLQSMKIFLWRWQSMRGHLFQEMQKFLSLCHKTN